MEVGDVLGVTGRDEREKLKRATQEFEALFLAYLLREMRAGLGKGGILPMGFAEEVYRDLLDGEVARAVAKAGGIGLWRLLYDRLASALPNDGGRG
jgi:flagellar protein FlgJ